MKKVWFVWFVVCAAAMGQLKTSGLTIGAAGLTTQNAAVLKDGLNKPQGEQAPLEQYAPPVFLSPTDDGRYRAELEFVNFIDFDCLTEDAGLTVVLQISQNADFSQIYDEVEQLEDPSFNVNLEAGEWYFRAKTLGQKVSSEWSEIKHSTFANIPDRPIIISPTSEFYEYPTTAWYFEWSPVPGAAKYEIQIATDEEFESLYLDEIIEENTSYEYQTESGWNGYWRVRAGVEFETGTGWSDWSSMGYFSNEREPEE